MVGSGTGGWDGKRPLQESAAIEKLLKRILQGAAPKARSIATSVGSVPDPAINSAVLAAPACEQMKGRDFPDLPIQLGSYYPERVSGLG